MYLFIKEVYNTCALVLFKENLSSISNSLRAALLVVLSMFKMILQRHSVATACIALAPCQMQWPHL